ncbi:MAG: prepilin-type N-terminal cleavage/methylation domain-containing protein [Deltaproteobacteria bacterium]|nr:prepilin-type N-terminal cleavage/methylation domain-containing protein [Deltaproteobacteria bacterium]
MNTNDRGFTLVELMIAMTVGLVVLGAVYALFTVQSKHLANQEQLAELHQNARVAMDMMVREISMAGYNQRNAATIAAATPEVPRCTNALVTAGTSCVGITYAGGDTIKFTADRDGSGSITPDDPTTGDNDNENVAYDINLSMSIMSLRRNSKYTKSGSSYQPVVEYVHSLLFEYYDGATPPATTAILANIRMVKITIVTRAANVDPNYTDPTYGDHYRRYTLSAFAFPRNLALSP